MRRAARTCAALGLTDAVVAFEKALEELRLAMRATSRMNEGNMPNVRQRSSARVGACAIPTRVALTVAPPGAVDQATRSTSENPSHVSLAPRNFQEQKTGLYRARAFRGARLTADGFLELDRVA